ncbi:MAG TPA: DUF2946 family protein [Paraburkholderia sp.]|uniref:DUF2946 family protein n=1 Tax=Paraburkholderia sp. TaxID=1926495 RepID=UPI002C95B584|nr:DUF2946 family protein [Paraburkholderia sp.]HTR08583.1 DUF2946 family protein [Paraburkholderia sp.]
MNLFRHFLSRGGVVRHGLFLLVFSVLMSRALLPGAVMIDPDQTAASGMLVICSGHGAMVIDQTAGFALDEQIARAAPTHVSIATDHASRNLHSGQEGNTSNKDSGVCAFSAALATALACAAVLLLLFLPLAARQFWPTRSTDSPARLAVHTRPLTRAPPVFS